MTFDLLFSVLITDSEAVSDDLFSVVFHSESSRSQWRYLLASGVTVFNPILIELAACLPVCYHFVNFEKKV